MNWFQTMRATQSFDCDDWRRKFQINIKFEIAADMGGLSREWFDILCMKLFDPAEGELPRDSRQTSEIRSFI